MNTILVLGGSGSLGNTLIKRYKNNNHMVIFSRSENLHWQMRQEYGNDANISYILGDIRDKEAVEIAIFRFKPEKVLILSAIKHIDICENNVSECVKTNIIGIMNVVDVIYNNAMKNTISFLKTVLFVSTDKATSPVNAYGMCKSLSERLVVEKSQHVSSPKFVVVRYGNVLNSRGSLIPLFHKIGIDPDKPSFTVTDERMTRFFMTLDESVNLIHSALETGESGDTYVPNIDSYKISDIAKLFSEKYNKPVTYTGLRPGEKMYEALVNITEIGRTIIRNNIMIIKPCYKNIVGELTKEYTSDNSLGNIDNIKQYLE